MPERPAASPPLAEARPVRQPPAHLGRAYASAFVETGVLEVVLPQTEQLPATAVTTTTTTATTATTAATGSLVPAPRAAVTSDSPTPVVPQASCTCPGRGRGQGSDGRRAGDLLTGVAIGVVLGLLAVVLAGLTAAQLGVLPR
ncbi:hypothetical protein [Quadrisphaera setariae]|uniref:Uncharacterized protein n=1 Tax=Quadrisphaera setariae TaxID=2593304 RepID=A0A5C8ZGW1_9ACTN|nr:hypothetical protein [Quadrisphaera setariae]TXR56774.1 hypothetical protein FMM08_08560 [Quadrisphaera setariae]